MLSGLRTPLRMLTWCRTWCRAPRCQHAITPCTQQPTQPLPLLCPLQADSFDEADNPDYVPPGTVYDVEPPSSSASSSGSSAAAQSEALVKQGKSALRKYIEKFDQTTMVETARIVSQEGAALVERQTTALFGDIKQLTQQMQVRWWKFGGGRGVCVCCGAGAAAAGCAGC